MRGDGRARSGGRDCSLPARLASLLLAGVVVATAVVGGVATATAQESDTALSLSVEPTEPAAPPGGAVNLTLTVENTGEERSVGPVVHLETLPEGWAVRNQTSEDATYRASTREWLWRGLDPGERGEATVTVALSGDADGTHDLPVSVDDAADTTAETTVRVTVDAAAASGTDGNGDPSDGGAAAVADGTGDLPLLPAAALAAAVVVAGLFYWRRGR